MNSVLPINNQTSRLRKPQCNSPIGNTVSIKMLDRSSKPSSFLFENKFMSLKLNNIPTHEYQIKYYYSQYTTVDGNVHHYVRLLLSDFSGKSISSGKSKISYNLHNISDNKSESFDSEFNVVSEKSAKVSQPKLPSPWETFWANFCVVY